MIDEGRVKISVITATYNAEPLIGFLIESLEGQSDQNFEWVVVDGRSDDDTARVVSESKIPDIKLISEKDRGIYDALNKGVKIARGTYYLVAGADDRLDVDAILNFKRALNKGEPDFMSACVEIDGKQVVPGFGRGRSKGLSGETSGHAVSLLIKRSLHKKFGFYNQKFPICADQLFVLSALNNGASISREKFVAGTYSSNGFSGQDILAALLEGFRVRVKVYGFSLSQTIILFMKILKNYKKIKATIK